MIHFLRAIRNRVRAFGEQHELTRRVAALEQGARRDRTRWLKRRSKWEDRRVRLMRKKASIQRQMLSTDVVEELLPLRSGTIGARVAYARGDDYDVQLQAASPPYRDALAELTQPRPDIAETKIQGLTWWVPLPSTLRGAVRDRFIAEQRFPFRTLTQTREFAAGPVLLDIGANIGRVAISRLVLGDVQRVYCAEPDPLNYAALVRNVASNGLRGLVLPDRAAIGAITGPIRLQHAKYPGGHRLVASQQSDDGTIEVACFTLDDWCRRLSIDPELVNYVKVDTQGWEVHVLRGASDLLTYPHIAWQIEVAPALLEAAGTPPRVLYELCARHFTDFIDLDKEAVGPRVRKTSELSASLEYLLERNAHTDIILFRRGADLSHRDRSNR